MTLACQVLLRSSWEFPDDLTESRKGDGDRSGPAGSGSEPLITARRPSLT